MTRSKAIIFDLDDTLYAERDYVLSGFQAVASWAQDALGASPAATFRELVQLLDDGCYGNTFNIWLESRGVEPSSTIVEAMVDTYRSHEPNISITEEVRTVLTDLHGSGYQLGLVSDGYLEVQRKKFAALQLADLFTAVVFSDQFGREHWKPSTRPFQAVLQRLQVNAADSVYVADNPTKDFIGPNQLGMKSIRLRSPEGLHGNLDAVDEIAQANIEITHLREITPYIDGFFR